jgi:glycosyltransferase involved in cell wall biosynthesis
LRRLLASLIAQTYQEWDLIIVDDSLHDMLDEIGKGWLTAIERDHRVIVQEGARINQAYSHNYVLWHPDARSRILRVDDDMVLDPLYIETLVQTWTDLKKQDASIQIGALSGTIFTDHVLKRDESPPIPTEDHASTEVAQNGSVMAWPFMQEYSDNELIPAQHLYSSCLYSRAAMKRVGGWPITYSKAVSYHEETDGTYRLHLAGYKMFLVPEAKATHSHEFTGGTRMLPSAEHKRRRDADWRMFLRKIPRIRAVDYRPSVAICSDHCSGIGGGQRLTYTLLSVLQQHAPLWFNQVDLYPMRTESAETPEFIKEHYGIERVDTSLPKKRPEHYDIVISIGHKPPTMDAMPPRIHHIHYSLFPQSSRDLPKGVDRYICISEFSAEYVRQRYWRNAEVIYPCIDVIEDPGPLNKDKNSILVVGRIDKAVGTLISAFGDLGIEGSKLTVVVPALRTSQERSFIRGLGLVSDEDGKHHSADGSVSVLIGVSRKELHDLYRSSAVLWAGRGLWASAEEADIGMEHFGYTPPEALHFYCVPVAYDAGGYAETTLLRWKDVGELLDITRRLFDDMEFWEESLRNNRETTARFSQSRFVTDWLRVITSTNTFSWSSDVEWRTADDPDIIVQSTDKHVALIGGHPGIATAYGVITDRLGGALIEAGWKVHVFGINGFEPTNERDYASLWPSPPKSPIDPIFKRFIHARDYDAAVVQYDPWVTAKMVSGVRLVRYRIPTVAFTSQEGAPAHPEWRKVLSRADIKITYCKAAVDAIKDTFDHKVDWVHLGIDHAPFESYDDEDRHALRSFIDIQDKYVIFNVCRNTRNKRVAGMIKVVKILKERYGHDDILLMLHTDPNPEQYAHGCEVEHYASIMGLNMEEGDLDILISPKPVDYELPYEANVEEILRGGRPQKIREKHDWFRKLPLIARYNMADLYLDMSSVEGFGLTVFEAAQCGVPVLTVDDNFVRTELLYGVAEMIAPSAVADEWITGADLAMVDPHAVAERIHEMKTAQEHQRPTDNKRWQALFNQLRWETTCEKIVQAVHRCLEM